MFRQSHIQPSLGYLWCFYLSLGHEWCTAKLNFHKQRINTERLFTSLIGRRKEFGSIVTIVATIFSVDLTNRAADVFASNKSHQRINKNLARSRASNYPKNPKEKKLFKINIKALWQWKLFLKRSSIIYQRVRRWKRDREILDRASDIEWQK